MKLQLKAGTTSKPLYVFVQDSSVTTGAGKTGLVFNSAGLVAYYVRPLGSATVITLVTQTVTGAYSSGGFVEIDATNMPGLYRFDMPDAALATGVSSVVVMLKGATNMAPVVLEIELVAYDPQSATNLGLSNLDATVSSRSTYAGGAVASVTAAVTVGTNNDKTGYALSAAGSAALTESYAADGAAATLPQLLYMILALLSEFAISGTTLTAKKLDGTTAAGTFTLDSATSPTSITRAT